MEKKKLHPAWLNVIALCLIMAGTYGVLVNCIGILFTAIMQDTGIQNGALSVYYTVRNLTCALTTVFTVRLFNKKNANVVIGVLCAIMALGVGAMAFFTKVYQWYISALFTGLGQSIIYTSTPIVINNWFKSRNGLALGLSMSASGLFSTIFSPIASSIILAFGWRTASVVLMAISLVLTVPASIVLRRDPEGSGYDPIGEGMETVETKKKSLPKQYIIPGTCVFVLLIVYVAFGSIFSPINHQLAVFGNATGFGLTFGALLTSCSMVGNIVGKLGIGVLTDRIGIFKSMCLTLLLVITGLLLFLTTHSRIPLMIGALFYGVTFAFPSAQSLVILEMYGPSRYKDKLAFLSSIGGAIGAFMSSIVGFIYDFFHSYTPVFIYAICAAVIQIIVFNILNIYKKNRLKKYGPAPQE